MARGGGRAGGGSRGRGGGGSRRSGGFGGGRGGAGRRSSGGRGGARPRRTNPTGQQRRRMGPRRGPVIMPGPIIGGFGPRRRRVRRMGPIIPPRGPRRPMGGGGGGLGCSPIILILGFIILISLFSGPNLMGDSTSSNNNSIQASTVEREPLPSGAVVETDYYTDEANWVESQTVMNEGLRYFYQKTGVQPHVYITEEIDGSSTASPQQVQEFANEQYDELFEDEAHLLLVFYEGIPSDYQTYYVVGSQAEQVIDSEAGDILLDYLDRYYYDGSLNTSQYFSKSFSDAADRMMDVTRSPWIPVFMIFGVILLIGIAYLWWRRRQEQAEIEARRTEEILNQPIETFGTESDEEVDDLIRKYEDNTEE